MSTITAVDTVASAGPAASPEPAEVVLARLYERHSSRIFGFCRRRLRTPQEAEDALQNTFIAALQALQRGTVPVCETAWLFKIAENACHGVYRSGARRDDRELTEPEALAGYAGPERGGDALVGLDAALGSIPENQRKAFVLRELRGLSYVEIARELGVTVASVETLIYRARRGLARALESGVGLRKRVAAAFDVGSIVTGAKAWLGGMSAMKVAAAAAVVTAAAVPARTLITEEHHKPAPTPPVQAATTPDPNSADQSHVRPTALPSSRDKAPNDRPATRRPSPSTGRAIAPTGPKPSQPGRQQPDRPAEPSPEAPLPPTSPPTASSPPPAAPSSPPATVPAPPPVDLAPVTGALPPAPPLPAAPPLPDVPAVPDPDDVVGGLPLP